MANPRRQERLASLIEQVVSELLQREIKDPRVAGLISITAVEVSADVRQAKIHVSVMGTEEERQATMRALDHATGFLRSKLGEELTIRHVPELSFHLDRSIERGDRVLALLSRLEIPNDAGGGSRGRPVAAGRHSRRRAHRRSRRVARHAEYHAAPSARHRRDG